MTISEVLNKHLKWLRGENGGQRASLSFMDLSNMDLRGANLSHADLFYNDLHNSDLSYVDLNNACLIGSDLRCANMRGVNLTGAYLYGANLCGAKNINDAIWDESTLFFTMQCPEHGAYIGFKKVHGLIVELEIPADALRSSAITRKCRASKARVISITNVDGSPAGDSVASVYDADFIYRIGEVVEVPNFDTDRWNECSYGIHHFITREEAVEYMSYHPIWNQ